jgi:hypothetical protein
MPAGSSQWNGVIRHCPWFPLVSWFPKRVVESEAAPITAKSGNLHLGRLYRAWATEESSWIDLPLPIDYRKGERLTLHLEGDAENVRVRLLPAGFPSDSKDGIEGGVWKVPANHTLVITLHRDHPNVQEISVHAGREAFGQSLGADNGTIILLSIEPVQ